MLTLRLEGKEKERRRSKRWLCEKPIEWRVQHSRRVRHGMVPERSLYGMVITAAKADAVPKGTFVYPGDDRSSIRHGFLTGVITRTAELNENECLLYIDILR
jgi:hypothetical protein